MKLWYKQPAQNFNEALPLGNGHIGAMHYGNPVSDRLSLNDDTLWSGYPVNINRKGAYKYLPEIRRLIDNHEFQAAEKIVERELLSNCHENYLPIGNLYLDFGIKKYDNYKRQLDLENALTITEFDSDGAHYIIKCFITHPDDCLIYSIECSDDRELEISLLFSNQLMCKAEFSDIHSCYYLYGYAPENSPPHYNITDFPTIEGNKGMGFAVVIKTINGAFASSYGFDSFHINSNVIIKGKNKISFALTTKTGFNGFDTMPSRDINDLRNKCIKQLDNVISLEEQIIYRRHIEDYKSLFNRTAFSLHSEKINLPTDERLINNFNTKSDKGLIELLFNYGKYLTISASRKGSQCMTLQGIWNDNLKPPWSSNYTVNINTQMNYWPTDILNLSECMYPLIELISELTQNGKLTAKEMYSMNGACAHHNSDIWRKTSPVSRDVAGSARWAMWPMSLSWLCSHLYEHYLFTGDKEFLRNTAYDSIYQSALFILDWFYEEDGILKSCPSTSPENAYIFNKHVEILSYSSTMDISIAKKLFTILIQTENTLDIKNGLKEKAQNALNKLPEYKIGSKGQLLEYSEDFVEAEKHHRHKSHLVGVYPFSDASIYSDKDLINAVKISMNNRGDESTGWSLAWKICIWARLFDGERAEKLLQNQLRPVFKDGNNGCGGIYMNMFDAHPPFQIDGNFGATAGICEMLLQSHNGVIQILPSIPKSWESGEVYGLKTRGNIQVDIVWNTEKIEVELLSCRDINVPVKINNCIKQYELHKNVKKLINFCITM